jgi:hypothetical protein
MSKFIEHCHAALDDRQTICRRLDSTGAPIDETRPKGLFEVGDCF